MEKGIKQRGGDHGGGPLPRRVELSEKAAQYIRQRTTITGTRFRTTEASETANTILEALADGNAALLFITADTPALLAWLEAQRQTLDYDSPECRALDTVIAALWTRQGA